MGWNWSHGLAHGSVAISFQVIAVPLTAILMLLSQLDTCEGPESNLPLYTLPSLHPLQFLHFPRWELLSSNLYPWTAGLMGGLSGGSTFSGNQHMPTYARSWLHVSFSPHSILAG